MVYAKNDSNALARVSVVSFNDILLDIHVQRDAADVFDYRTDISGVEESHLQTKNGAVPFDVVQQKVLDLISRDTILVGHSKHSDLRALRSQQRKIVDTALLFQVAGGQQNGRHKLHSLASLLRWKIVLRGVDAVGAHDPQQDAEWALQSKLYEAYIFPRRTEALKLESCPMKIFLYDIPRGTELADIQALVGHVDVGEIGYRLGNESSGK